MEKSTTQNQIVIAEELFLLKFSDILRNLIKKSFKSEIKRENFIDLLENKCISYIQSNRETFIVG